MKKNMIDVVPGKPGINYTDDTAVDRFGRPVPKPVILERGEIDYSKATDTSKAKSVVTHPNTGTIEVDW